MISFVIPCHNEEKLLLYSLKPLLEHLNDEDEVVFVIDRCTDNTEAIVNWFKKKCKAQVKIIHKNSKFVLNKPSGDAYLYGVHFASGDRIVQLGADVVVNKKVLNIIRNFNKTPFKFQVIEYRSHFRYAYHKLLSFFAKSYCLEVYQKSEMDKLIFYDFPSTVDVLLQNLSTEALSQWHKVNVPILHLRAFVRDKTERFTAGFKRAFRRHSFLKTLLHSVLFGRPEILVGYLYFKFREGKLREYFRRRMRKSLEKGCECRFREALVAERQAVHTC